MRRIMGKKRPTPLKSRSEKTGLPPGSLVYVGKSTTKEPIITIIDYNKDSIEEKKVYDAKFKFKSEDKEKVRWINVEGIHEVELIEEIGRQFDFHPLLLEDILNTHQRPKVEDYGKYEAIFLRMTFWKEDKKIVEQEQTTLIIGENYVISLQENEQNEYDLIRERLKKGYGKIRSAGADYLLYALIDIVIDNYFLIMDKIGEQIESIEDEIEEDPSENTSQKIHHFKRVSVSFRKAIWPLREVINKLQRGDSELILDTTQIYLRDLYDHVIQIIDNTETFRDLISGLRENYISHVSNRMNQIINVLTIISTIFIPLSFLAGLYGMNFVYMPELQNPMGYFILLIVMGSIAAVMLTFFRHKKWL